MKQTIKSDFLADVSEVVAAYFGEGTYALVDYTIHCGLNVEGKNGLELGLKFIVMPIDEEANK